MIKVTCTVKSVEKDHMESIIVESSDSTNDYNTVAVHLSGGNTIYVNGNDLITAIENCTNKGRCRYYIPQRRSSSEDE